MYFVFSTFLYYLTSLGQNSEALNTEPTKIAKTILSTFRVLDPRGFGHSRPSNHNHLVTDS